MTEHLTTDEYLEGFTFLNPDWEERLQKRDLLDIFPFLDTLRETGDFNMASPEVTFLLQTAFLIGNKEARNLQFAWMSSKRHEESRSQVQ